MLRVTVGLKISFQELESSNAKLRQEVSDFEGIVQVQQRPHLSPHFKLNHLMFAILVFSIRRNS